MDIDKATIEEIKNILIDVQLDGVEDRRIEELVEKLDDLIKQDMHYPVS